MLRRGTVRAQVSDIAIAVREGADAVMLSGESAYGKFPFKAVDVMSTVAQRTESAMLRFSVRPPAPARPPAALHKQPHPASRLYCVRSEAALHLFSVFQQIGANVSVCLFVGTDLQGQGAWGEAMHGAAGDQAVWQRGGGAHRLDRVALHQRLPGLHDKPRPFRDVCLPRGHHGQHHQDLPHRLLQKGELWLLVIGCPATLLLTMLSL